MGRASAALACALALLVAGCGPSLRSLVSAKHYREAICAAHDGSADDRAMVARALARDADVLVHVHVVTDEELQPLLNDATADVRSRARIVRVRAQSNVLPVDLLQIGLSFETAAPASWETLAYATNEKLPPKRKEQTYATGMNLLKAAGAIFTVGLSLPFTDFNPEVIEVDAPLSEYRRMAPLADALYGSLPSGRCSSLGVSGGSPEASRSGQRCEWFFVADAKVPLELKVALHSTAMRRSPDATEAKTWNDDPKNRCTVVKSSIVALGPPGALEAETQKLFGPRMRRLSEIEAK